MHHFEITPKNLLLGVMQTGSEQAIPIRMVTEIGLLFGFSSNVMRVNVTRLLSSGTLEQDERGYYRLNPQSSIRSTIVDSWHMGEPRRVPWNESWLMSCLPEKKSITNDKQTIQALTYLGFKPSEASKWVRPNNLTLSRSDIEERLQMLGITSHAQLYVVSECSELLENRWRRELWPIQEHQKNYQAQIKAIKQSKKALKKMPLNQAVVESFMVGSEVVNTLAIDPLLPEEIMNSKYRTQLTELMKDYDLIGQEIWNRKFQQLELEGIDAPKHLNLLG